MMEIALTVCMLAHLDHCENRTQPFDGSIFACTILGQQLAADWIAHNPKWTVRKYRCQPRGRGQTA